MAGKKGGRRIAITQEEYDNVKQMSNHGLSVSLIAKVTGRGYNTVAYIVRSETIEEYKAVTSQYWRKAKAKEAAKKAKEEGFEQTSPAFNVPEETVPVQTVDMTTVISRLDSIQIALDQLIEAEDARSAAAKHNAWRFGKSR